MSTVYVNQPGLDTVKTYLGASDTYEDAEVQSALDSETAAQLTACKIPSSYDADTDTTTVTYPDDLAEALCRRVHHNLALRGLPLGIQPSFADGAVTVSRVGGTDAEVARLERPYRKLVMA